MLERASSPAECAAHLFLRTLEKPVKSRRSLGQSFWRHGGDHLDVPAWWPAYLADIRRSSNSLGGYPQLPSNSTSSASSRIITLPHPRYGQLTATAARSIRPPRAPDGKTRSFTDLVSPNQRLYVPNDRSKSQDIRRSVRRQDAVLQPSKRSAVDDMLANLLDGVAPLGKQSIYPLSTEPSSKIEPDFRKAWALFIQSGHKQDISTSMLHLMAQSHQRIHLIHALRVFDFIPTTQRTISDYEVAIDVASKLKRYNTAITLLSQVLAKGHGENVYFKFMAFCVSHTLWNTLAALWKMAGTAGRALIQSNNSQSRSKSPNIAGSYSFHFDTIDDFPGKVVSLADRLAGADAVLAANRRPLIEICKRLAYIAAESQQVMAIINGSQALALFSVQEKLHFNSKLHVVAIGAIMKLQERGLRSQLALLIYRNLRFASPDTVVPRWVYGALIGICADGRQPVEAYKYILDEIRQQHGKIDYWSQQQALAAYAKQGEVAAVFDLFKQFCESGRPRDLRDVHHLLHVFAVVGDYANTQVQFDRLAQEFGFQPNVVSWSLLLLAHARSKLPETTFDCFERMKLAGMTPNTVSWSILISVAAKQGDMELARRLYEQARSQNVPGSIYMVGSMVDSLLSNKEVEQAESIVVKASAMRSRESSIRLWNSLLRYYAFRSDTTSIFRVQLLMKEHNVKPDHMTYAALMTAFVVKGQTSNAAKLLRTLQTSLRLSPTEFHYSILVHGYVQEGKRDPATAMYHEMLERYPRGSASAKLAMLRLQLRRDMHAIKHSGKAGQRKGVQESANEVEPGSLRGVEYLADILLQDPRIDAASPVPNPGFRRQTARDGLDTIYFGSLISFLQQNMAHAQSETLLETVDKLSSSAGTSPTLTLTNMTFRMTIAIQKEDWVLVDDLWRRLCKLALELYSPSRWQRASQTTPSQRRSISHGVTLLGSDESSFRSMMPVATLRHSISQIPQVHQFALSWPLSIYLQALDYQGRHGDATMAVNDLEDSGFTLSSRNWNRYIQVLSKSTQFKHQLLAFQHFEDRMLQSQGDLHWNLIRRGKHILRVQSRVTKNNARPSLRKKLERSDPGNMMPSYFTMIHLAASLMKIHQTPSTSDTPMMEELQNAVPRTLRLVRQVPYLADRVQGVLLRGRDVLGDREPRPRLIGNPLSHIGQNDSVPPLDRLPVSVLDKAKTLLAPQGGACERPPSSDIKPMSENSAKRGNVRARLAEFVRREEARSGSIDRNAIYIEKHGRFENERELQQRIRLQEESKLQPYIDLAEEALGKIRRRREFLQAQGRKETGAEAERRTARQTLQYLDFIEKIRAELQMPVSVRGVHSNDVALSTPSQDAISSVPKAIISKSLANILLNDSGTGAALQIIKARGYDPLLSNDSGEKEDQDSQSDGEREGSRSHVRQKSFASSYNASDPSRHSDSPKMVVIKSSASAISARIMAGQSLRRRIAPRYQNRGVVPPRRIEARRRGAWSINKAQRRSRLRNKQSYDRWQLQVRKEFETRRQESMLPRTGVRDETVTTMTDNKETHASPIPPVSRAA